MIEHNILALTIIIAGLLGGIINYFMVHVKEEKFSNYYIFLKSIFLGLGASALIPLFLNLIGSKLLESVGSPEHYPFINYYVIGGFCLAGSIYSNRFIEDVYSRITNAEKVAKDAQETADEAKKTTNEIEESVTENDEPVEILNQNALPLNPPDEKAINFNLITQALKNSHYVYRTSTGISKETGIEKSILIDNLDEMIDLGLIKSKINRNGNRVFKAVT